jgi:ubiquinone/menaquinone biosynthesis C-methylase UbiE
MTIALVAAGIGALTLVFVLITDGRYFGKGLTRWVYDRLGPSIFGLRSEADRWRTLAGQLSVRGDERALDVGTATGDLPLSWVSVPEFRGRFVGVDWSPRMIAAASRAADQRGLEEKARFQVVDLRRGLPFEEAEFDLVFCLGLLETLPHPASILGELCRVLVPGGRIVLSLYRGWSLTGATLSLKWYRRHLAALGLGDLRVLPCRRSQDVVVARRAVGPHALDHRHDARQLDRGVDQEQ